MLNVGGPEALPLSRIGEIVSAAAGAPNPVLRPFPQERKRIDIGSYASDSTRIGEVLGWQPVTPFADGIRAALEFYRAELQHYLRPEDAEPTCPLEEAHSQQAVAVS
jgi:UDP-glucose 4-epimerase